MRFPVSVKGVILSAGRTVLLENERREWELPGGKLEAREEPEECLAREVLEETGLKVEVGPLLDAWVYRVRGAEVFVVAYGCPARSLEGLRRSEEHSRVREFECGELPLDMPERYGDCIRSWRSRGL